MHVLMRYKFFYAQSILTIILTDCLSLLYVVTNCFSPHG